MPGTGTSTRMFSRNQCEPRWTVHQPDILLHFNMKSFLFGNYHNKHSIICIYGFSASTVYLRIMFSLEVKEHWVLWRPFADKYCRFSGTRENVKWWYNMVIREKSCTRKYSHLFTFCMFYWVFYWCMIILFSIPVFLPTVCEFIQRRCE